MTDAQGGYARARAAIEVLIDGLREALGRHEARGDWARAGDLDRVEQGLTRLLEEVP